MERRNFLRAMLGVAAATALPSEIWPFKKIFLPPTPKISVAADWGFADSFGISYYAVQTNDVNYFGLSRSKYPGRLGFVVDSIDHDAREITLHVERFKDELVKRFSESTLFIPGS